MPALLPSLLLATRACPKAWPVLMAPPVVSVEPGPDVDTEIIFGAAVAGIPSLGRRDSVDGETADAGAVGGGDAGGARRGAGRD